MVQLADGASKADHLVVRLGKMRIEKRLILWLGVAWLSLVFTTATYAEKTDLISISNGNEIIGEIKSLHHGQLRVSTDYMRSVNIDWEQIQRVQSTLEFEVQLLEGERYYGRLAPSDEDRVLIVATEEGTNRIPFDLVLNIDQTRSTARGKVDASISVGFNFTQATNVTQTSLDASYQRRTLKFSRSLHLVALLSDTDDETFSRGDFSFNLHRHLEGRWNWDSTMSLQTNEQLGLDRRTIVTGSAQHRTVRTRIRELWLGAGLSASRERFVGLEPSDTSVEIALSVRYFAFHFDNPELQVELEWVAFPSVTNSGRVRSELRADLRREIVSDLFWGFSVYGSYDNEPTGPDTVREDIAVVASVGWKY